MINRKKTQRLYREEELTVRRRRGGTGACWARGRRRRCWRSQPALEPRLRPRSDGLGPPVPGAQHRRRRDPRVPACRGRHVDLGRRVVRELVDLIAERGAPEMIVSDNGTELTSNAVLAWCGETGSGGITSRRANRHRTGSSRASTVACATSFSTRRCSSRAGQARAMIGAGRTTITPERPHSSLGYATPAAFAAELEKQRAGLTPPVASPALMRDNTGRPLVAAG